jgi:hypothetical protein
VSDPHPGVSGSTQFLNRQRGAGSGPGSERSQLSAFGLLFALAGCAVDADVALPVDALSPDEPGASSERPTSEPPDIDATPGRELPSCAEDALLCGATCVDPNLDADHCGSCGARCGADQLCGDGICNRHDWSRRIAGKGWQRVAAVAVDSRGDLAVAGSFAGTLEIEAEPWAASSDADGFVAKLSPRGSADFDSGVMTAENPDAFVARLSPGLIGGWSQRYGGPGAQAAERVAVDASGRALVVGSFQGELDLGLGSMWASEQDGFVAAFYR